ncbi:MAG: primary-amine oxidase [Sphingomonadales bacterium]|jgi:primary-amine oxidase|nr:primary-amine oxidase [Sphingomonadales bacterium]
MNAAFLRACAALAGLGAAGAAGAQSAPCPVFSPPTGQPGLVEQTFPTSPSPGAPATAWRVRFAHATGRGLYITGASFRTAPNRPWTQILYDARLADIFVPYEAGSPRFYDLTNYNFPLVPATAADAGPCGRIIDGKVVHEVTSYGLMWKDDQAVRHGQELVLWATLDSANYNYIMRYGFRDDGTITLRLGATSRNLPGMELMGHMHNALWRIDMDLNGAGGDSAYTYEHVESTSANTASDTFTPFNGGREGWLDVDPTRFTELVVRDTSTSTSGTPISYEFRPVRNGAPRHREAFAHHDFWVTRYRGTEMLYTLPQHVNNESVMNSDIVVWHITGLRHDPRNEDGFFQGNSWNGVALVMWGGLDLRPRNLFTRTPLFP